MFFKMRKSTESGEGQSPVPDGDEAEDEESGEGIAADGEKAIMEGPANRKPVDLEVADGQLGQLGGVDEILAQDGGGEGVEDIFTKPNLPQGLVVETASLTPVEGEDPGSLLAGIGEAEKTGKEKEEEEENSLYDIFNDDEEEEENPLKGLISTLPDVTAQELFDEAKEVNELLREWR